jgi:hypothetical protein
MLYAINDIKTPTCTKYFIADGDVVRQHDFHTLELRGDGDETGAIGSIEIVSIL